MIKVASIVCPLDWDTDCRGGTIHTDGFLVDAVAKRLGCSPVQISSVEVLRRSIDARRKSDVHFVVNAAVTLCDAQLETQCLQRGVAAEYAPYIPLEIPLASTQVDPPVIVGTGPAGLFAALYLARAGAKPVVVERGPSVDRRAKAVAQLNTEGVLDVQANIQFGEGGAGTFSDGKLTTGTKHAMVPHVLHWFVEAGAPACILWDAKPHIGSDKLPAVVAAMRNEIIERGGQVLFDTQLTDLSFREGKLATVGLVNVHTGHVHQQTCRQLVLACGHSARDTFALMQKHRIHLEQKPFSMGVRIEHRQDAINQAQWGRFAAHPALGAADYKLAVHPDGDRSVYTFCMCPGGDVVCAASEEGGVATNGASPFARDGLWANAAVLANVYPTDFGSNDPLAGVYLQREIEQRAFNAVRQAGGLPYQAPAQTLGSFLKRRLDSSLPQTTYARGVVAADLHDVLPGYVCNALEAGFVLLGKKLAGFDDANALLIGPETRSSSPVRICRNDSLQAWLDGVENNAFSGGAGVEAVSSGEANCSNPAIADSRRGCGIYPAGEGAGYAGGIMSAACDGLRVASQVLSDLLSLA